MGKKYAGGGATLTFIYIHLNTIVGIYKETN